MTYEDVGFLILISLYGWQEAVKAVQLARRMDTKSEESKR